MPTCAPIPERWLTRPLGIDLSQGPAHPWPPAECTQGPWFGRGVWPARWVHLGDEHPYPLLAAYALQFPVADARTIRVYVSADERYDLFLDGQRIGRGPGRGDVEHWCYEGYDLPLAPGEHVLVARVWSLGLQYAPWAQVRLKHGLIVAPAEIADAPILATGIAPWRCRELHGYRFERGTSGAWHADERVDGTVFEWDFLAGTGEGWSDLPQWGGGGELTPAGYGLDDIGPRTGAHTGFSGRSTGCSSFIHTFEHFLTPSRLPAQRWRARQAGSVRLVDAAAAETALGGGACFTAETRDWQRLVDGQSITVPAHAQRRILVDLGDYVCGYFHAVVAGGAGATIGAGIDEALYAGTMASGQAKRPRHLWDGMHFASPLAQWTTDGGPDRHVETLWWRAGRWMLVTVTTQAEPLTIRHLWIEETGYPYEEVSPFECDDAELQSLATLCVHTAASCAHETFVDCPYYEQQMWVGDMRVQMLINHAVMLDDRLVRSCIDFIGRTRWDEGVAMGRYPAPQRLSVPGFSLWWAAMVYDHALWRGDRDFTREQMRPFRGVLDYALSLRDDAGLVRTPPGWNFTDWASGWKWGIPPSSEPGPGGVNNWQLVLLLGMASHLEAWLGEPELAQRWRRLGGDLAVAARQAFWCEDRGLFADDLAKSSYSEHAQAMAVLSGRAGEHQVRRLRESLPAGGIVRTTLYFDHYLLSAAATLGLTDWFFARLEPYRGLAGEGLFTTPETTSGGRSDCHAWSAHPRYHFVASVLGVTPVSLGFEAVRIKPMLGPLREAKGVVPHPKGPIHVALKRRGADVEATVSLPPGLPGVLEVAGHSVDLAPGTKAVHSLPLA